MVTDEQIKKDIVDNLYWDSRIDASNVTVEVNAGRVILSGTVPTYTAKTAARENVSLVEGVIAVDNNIQVALPGAIEVPTDDEITERISNALLFNPDLDSTEITVNTVNGEVSFEGTVDTYWKKIRAEDLAYRVTGVWNVINRLTVVPTEDIDDKNIAEEIMAVLTRRTTVDEQIIDVTVEKGIVTLSGEVPNWTAYSDAEDAAFFTSGVINVNNNLLIRGP